ncbi:MAG: hypothetical protein C0523_08700 [Cytophaga sp.]|nr:hypothetical protein [Cytophaga sp.]
MNKYLLPLLLLFAACSNDSDPVADKSSFTKIYDSNKFSASFYPIDVKQTPDGGFLILGGRRLETIPGSEDDFPGTYVMKTDEFGAFVSDNEIGTDLVNPVGLLESNGKYYFFGMNAANTQTNLVEMDADGKMNTPILIGNSYPSAAAQDGVNFILLNYDHGNKQSVLSIVTPAGQVSKTQSFSIGAGNDHIDDVIISHFLRTGKQIPFFVGKTTSGQYYFNGFYDYTLSLIFTDLNADDPQGEVHGYSDDGGLSMVLPVAGNQFAISRFNFGDNYVLPNATLKTSGLSSSVNDDNLKGYSIPEIVPNAPVKIINTTIAAKEYLIYATNTRSRQIALLLYDKATGEFKGSHYLGFSNPFEVASVINTADGGLAVCGTTYVAGRFPRICLFKLSSEQLSKIIK